jgi:hypothetical protein
MSMPGIVAMAGLPVCDFLSSMTGGSDEHRAIKDCSVSTSGEPLVE